MVVYCCCTKSSLSLGSVTTNQGQMSVTQNSFLSLDIQFEYYHALCLYGCVCWALACLHKTACIAWLLWSVYPCCGEVQLHKAVRSWTLPLPSLPLVKQHPINRPLAIFRLAKLWFTCQWLHWWCLCTGPQYTSTAVLMVSGLLSLPHHQNVSQKSQGYKERRKSKFPISVLFNLVWSKMALERAERND